MIVDLVRNDLSRVAALGTVRVRQFRCPNLSRRPSFGFDRDRDPAPERRQIFGPLFREGP